MRTRLHTRTRARTHARRAYFENNYEVIKRLNPRLPVLLRNNDDASPYIIARYDFGERAEVSVADMTEAQIDEEVRKLVEAGLKQKRSAESLVPFELPTVTD